MKNRFFCLVFFLVFALLQSYTVYASNDGAFVSVTVKGEAVLRASLVPCTDSDGDGTVTLNDAVLSAALANGLDYKFAEGDYGLYIVSLCGDKSGAFGCLVNDAPAMSLSDPIKPGDRVSVYVYADQIGYSDQYTYFSTQTLTAKAGGEVEVTLLSSGYDENWMPVTLPVSGAALLLDGRDTGIVTDADGKATVPCDKAGKFALSSRIPQPSVPAYAELTVTEAPETADRMWSAGLTALLFAGLLPAVVKKKK